MHTTKKNNLLEYKGHPLMRKENIYLLRLDE